MRGRGQGVEIPAPGGAMPGWRYEPDASEQRLPGVLVLPDAFGAADHIQDAARHLAGDGFLTLVPDLFHRERQPVLAYGDPDRLLDRVMRTVALSDAPEERSKDDRIASVLGAALDAIGADARVQAGRVGVLGYGVGGRLGLLLACRKPDRVGAVVSVSGSRMVPLLSEVEAIRSPLLLVFGARDPAVTEPEIERIRAELQYRKKVHEIRRYPDAESAFYCPALPAHDPAAAADAWDRSVAWLRKHLG